MTPPEKVTTPEFIERLRKTVLQICEERTGNKFALDQNGNAGKY